MARKQPAPIRLSLKCSCSGSLYGGVSPAAAAMKIRDIFLRTHPSPEHRITDRSLLLDQSVLLRSDGVS